MSKKKKKPEPKPTPKIRGQIVLKSSSAEERRYALTTIDRPREVVGEAKGRTVRVLVDGGRRDALELDGHGREAEDGTFVVDGRRCFAAEIKEEA